MGKKAIVNVISSSSLENEDKIEIAFVGRSNVGKSSLINYLTNKKALARTSSTPGRTRLVNYFSINNGEFYFVDLPGYGYAKGNKQEQLEWKQLMESYFMTSKILTKQVFRLMQSSANANLNYINLLIKAHLFSASFQSLISLR